MALQVQSVTRPPCSSLLRLLGLMSAAIPAIPLIRLRSRFLQRSLIAVYRTEADGPLPVSLPLEAQADLRWVAQLRPQDCAASLWPPSLDQADLRVATDASDEGWSIYCLGRMEGARWAPEDAALHINVKELIVLHIFLRDFFPSITRRVRIGGKWTTRQLSPT